MKLGSHVSMKAPNYLVGSVNEAIKDGSNCFMIYTGAPQSTQRKDVEALKIDEFKQLLTENNIDINDLVVHAPYIMNLANPDPEKRSFAIDFLTSEILRTSNIGIPQIVLHPGAHVKQGAEVGIKNIITSLNQVLDNTKGIPTKIALETMAGKGTEIGRNFDELAQIINGVNDSERVTVCFDTCHTFDSGYDIVNDFEGVLKEFDEAIGIDKITCFHINDSKNILGSSKDRHENIGFGNIGFDALNKIINHESFKNIPKFLETPYVSLIEGEKDRTLSPYKKEIEMIKTGEMNSGLLLEIRNND